MKLFFVCVRERTLTLLRASISAQWFSSFVRVWPNLSGKKVFSIHLLGFSSTFSFAVAVAIVMSQNNATRKKKVLSHLFIISVQVTIT
mmetsp:Transcript_36760/g.56280  ORF Transcript_36760/g.56280 Transcript_36760/m.56280 type:complete len:88 (+) Transcript_36760:95-358(+)